jgi:hypothetical protein
MSRTTLKPGLARPTNRSRRGPDHVLSKDQLEQRARFIERAIACLDTDKFEEFWARMDIVNRYTRQCVDEWEE